MQGVIWGPRIMRLEIHIYEHPDPAIERKLDHISLTLANLGSTVMSAISDFAAAQKAFQDRMDTAITDLQGDVKSLNDQITALQNSAGQITPEDQKLLDDIQARSSTIADKLDALDAQTPPVPPAG